MTSKRRRPTERQAAARQSVDLTRQAVRQVEETDADDIDIDPASALFFEFAGPFLLEAQSDQQFITATAIAELVWAATFFDAATQAHILDDFIDEAGIPEEMIPWLLEVYDELAARKEALGG